MAEITITKFAPAGEPQEVADIANNQRRVRGLPELSTYSTEIWNLYSETWKDARIVRLARCRDAASKAFGILEVWLDPDCPVTAAIGAWLREWKSNWTLHPNGRLENSGLRRFPWEINLEYDCGRFYRDAPVERYSYSGGRTPGIELALDFEADRIEADLAHERQPAGEIYSPSDEQAEAKVTIEWQGVTTFNINRYHYGSASIDNDKAGTDLYGYLERRHIVEGFTIDGKNKTGFAMRGSLARAETAIGKPPEETANAISWGTYRAPVKRAGKRALDVGEISNVLPDDAIGYFPDSFAADPLAHSVRRVIDIGYGGYRRPSTQIVYENQEVQANVLRFGLTRDHRAIRRYDFTATLDGSQSLFSDAGPWARPVDQFLLLRSPVGWHGLFMLVGLVNLRGKNRGVPNAPVCYMVPFFIAHEDIKHTRSRYRHLPGDVIEAIYQTHGLDYVLTQAIYMLAGAKAKLARAGQTLHTLSPDKEPPVGHLIRAWGVHKGGHRYAIGSQADRRPTPNRAAKAAFDLLAWAGYGNGVPFGDARVVANQDMFVQPVATPMRRALDI